MGNRAKDYLAQFDEGALAHPDFCVKAAVVRAVSTPIDPAAIAAEIGDAFDALRILDAPNSSWIPEVQATAIYMAGRDIAFDSDDAFVEDAHIKNKRLLNSPLYRGLFFIMTKERIVKMGSTAFGMMHKGIQLKTHADAKRVSEGGDWDLISPPHLVPDLIARCYGTAFVVAAEIAGLPPMAANVTTISPTTLRITLRPTS